MDFDGPRFQRFFRIENEREDFVIDAYQAHRFFGGVAIDGRDGSHGIAGESYRVVEQIAFIARVAARPDYVAILARENRRDAWHGQSLGNIHATDASVGVRAAEHASVEHSRKTDIAGVSGRAGDALDGIDARGGMAD